MRALIEQVGLEQSYLERYPSQLSGGQRQRVGVARALALNPSVVVADEPTSALDVSVRAQIINLLCDLKEELGVSFVFISHDLSTVRYISDWIAVMYLGEVVEYGPAEQVFDDPAHPYTRALLDAVPGARSGIEAEREIKVISGELPSPLNIPPGCAFASRCPKVTDLCREEKPALAPLSPKRDAACHFAGRVQRAGCMRRSGPAPGSVFDTGAPASQRPISRAASSTASLIGPCIASRSIWVSTAVTFMAATTRPAPSRTGAPTALTPRSKNDWLTP